MAHKRKDTLANTVEWAKHLRPEGKRRQAKAERQAGRASIRKETKRSEGQTMCEIHIEPIALAHAPAIQQLASDPAISAMSHVPYPYPADGAVQWIKESEEKRQAGTAYCFAVIVSGKVVGACSLLDVADDSAMLGYWTGKPYWGHGYATKASKLVLAFGFSTLQIHTVRAECLERNVASLRVLQKLGFKLIGYRQNENPKWPETERVAEFELSREDWEPCHEER